MSSIEKAVEKALTDIQKDHGEYVAVIDKQTTFNLKKEY